MIRNLSCILVTVSVTLYSCATVSKNPFDIYRKIYEPAVDNLKVGRANYDSAINYFGEPESVIKTADQQTIVYSYFGDSLKINFAQDSLVSGYKYFSESFKKVEANNHAYDYSFSSDKFKKKLRKLRPGHSKYDDVVKHLGKPTSYYSGIQRNKMVYFGPDKNFIAYIQANTGLLIDYYLEDK